MSCETILAFHLCRTLHSHSLIGGTVWFGIMSEKRLNDVSLLGIGFMHMLSIVRMLDLSSKSLSITCRESDLLRW